MSDLPQSFLLLPAGLLKSLLDYMHTRPYGEVAEGVAQLQRLELYGPQLVELQAKLDETRQELADAQAQLANLRATET